MFLNMLQKKDKENFLKLAHYMARSDSDFSSEQKEIIATYCYEMQIDDIDFDSLDFNLEETLKEVTDKLAQKIMLLEIMALVYSDDILHQEEAKVIDKMVAVFGLDKNIAKLYQEWTKNILAVTKQGELLLEL